MKITFQMGSAHLNEVNQITFWEIKEEAQLQMIKQITRSNLLFNALEEVAHKLTIYLPHQDKNQNIYGNFEYFFKHDTYLNWKNSILLHFPELSEQLLAAEQDGKNRQELFRLEEELQCYNASRNPFGFHHNPLTELQQRINELREEIHPGDNYKFSTNLM